MNKEAVGTLTGKFFHSFNADEAVRWGGQFLRLASPGLYLVRLYGSQEQNRLVPATDMRYWRIYDTEEQWTAASEYYFKEEEKQDKKREREVRALSSSLAASADLVIQDGKIIKQRGNLTVIVDGAVLSGVKS